MPTVPIAIATRGDFSAEPFQRVIQLAPGQDSFADKIKALLDPPFSKTLFVDTDTECLESIETLFDALDQWDLLAAHAPVREHLYSPPGVPNYFPECNTGLLGVKRGDAWDRFVNCWIEEHEKVCEQFGPSTTDQPAFRSAMWSTKIGHLILTPEFNLRTCMRCFVGGGWPVRVIHDRTPRSKEAARIFTEKRIDPYPRIF